jgi:hypothetical protein
MIEHPRKSCLCKLISSLSSVHRGASKRSIPEFRHPSPPPRHRLPNRSRLRMHLLLLPQLCPKMHYRKRHTRRMDRLKFNTFVGSTSFERPWMTVRCRLHPKSTPFHAHTLAAALKLFSTGTCLFPLIFAVDFATQNTSLGLTDVTNGHLSKLNRASHPY